MDEPLRYEETLKPEGVETPLDRLFFRPAAHLVVQLCLPTPLGANGVTLLGALVGAAGASLFRFTSRTNLIVGATLLLVSSILDCADGQLARARGTASRLGRIIDGAGDLFVSLALLLGLALHLAALGQPVWLAFAGLGSLLLQWLSLDLIKNRFLTLSASPFREGDDVDETKSAITALAQGQASGAALLLHRVYLRVSQAQGVVLRLLPTIPDDPAAPARYAQELGPVMRVWAYLGPSTHAVLLAVFAVVGALPAYLWVRLTLGNVVLIGLFVATRRREGVVAAELRAPVGISGLL